MRSNPSDSFTAPGSNAHTACIHTVGVEVCMHMPRLLSSHRRMHSCRASSISSRMLRETVGCLLPSFGLNSRTVRQQLRQGLTRGAWSLQPSGSVGPERSVTLCHDNGSQPLRSRRDRCASRRRSLPSWNWVLFAFTFRPSSVITGALRVRVCVCAYIYIYIICVCVIMKCVLLWIILKLHASASSNKRYLSAGTCRLAAAAAPRY